MSLIILGCLMLVISSCTRSKEREWSILFQVIPEHLRTNEANINIIHYLLKQTHIPILQEVESGQYDSLILNKWSRSADNRFFEFCPNTNLKFNPTKSFTVNNLVESLNKIKAEINVNFNVTSNNTCVQINSKSNLPSLLKALTDFRYAPTIKCAPKWECGLGKYEVTQITASKFRLKRKIQDELKNGYDTIILAQADVLKNTETISDINRTIDEIPRWIDLSSYSQYDVNLLQTLILIINVPNINLRKVLYNCLNSKDLSIAFNPNMKASDKVDISRILPTEFYPNSKQTIVRSCADLPVNAEQNKLNFVNWRNNNTQTLSNYLNEIYRKTGITLQNLKVTPSDFVKALVSRNSDFKKYDLIPMAISAESTDLASFFRPIVASSKKYLKYNVPGAANVYHKLITTVDRKLSLALARKLADLIDNHYAAVPMYQVKKSFYYPSNIINLDTGRNFLEYPEVGKLEVN